MTCVTTGWTHTSCPFRGRRRTTSPNGSGSGYMVRGKLFAAVCSPGPEHRTYGGHDLVNLKCEPAESELLRAQYPEILPGFYTDKRTWIAVLLDGDLPDEVLHQLCADSHRLVLAKLPKYVQRDILEN